ncbi:MAG: hypothetical protein K9L78_01015 [Victivallales bacterium]|nr:hypothetical protein [Victivallales bacterium]MCF7888677.1 hypothetical protein [Victivallales bacterium]
MIFNLTKKKLIASSPVYFRKYTFCLSKIIGNNFERNDAVIFQNRNFILTLFIKLNVDIVFTDVDNKVCSLKKEFKNSSLFCFDSNAKHIVILPFGIIKKKAIEVGDYINLNTEMTTEFKDKLEKSLSKAPLSTPTVNLKLSDSFKEP